MPPDLDEFVERLHAQELALGDELLQVTVLDAAVRLFGGLLLLQARPALLRRLRQREVGVERTQHARLRPVSNQDQAYQVDCV